jgi:flavin-dependent dehydrogenase
VRRHIAVAPWSDCVEVHWQDGVEAYVTPVSATEVGVAFLWTPDDDADSGWDRFLDRFPALAARLGPAARGGARGTRGAGPFAVAVRPAARGRVLLAGDASGYVDAITGEGIGLAFAAAQALVRATGPDDDARPHAAARRYARALRRLRRRHEWLTRVLLTVAGRPALRRRYVAALAASPRAFGGLLALSSGACGWGRALPSLAALAARTVIPGARSAPPRPAPAPRRAAG